jgi:hypothetical protein
LKTFLTQFAPALLLIPDPPVRLHDNQKRWNNHRNHNLGSVSARNIIYLSPTTSLSTLHTRWAHHQPFDRDIGDFVRRRHLHGRRGLMPPSAPRDAEIRRAHGTDDLIVARHRLDGHRSAEVSTDALGDRSGRTISRRRARDRSGPCQRRSSSPWRRKPPRTLARFLLNSISVELLPCPFLLPVSYPYRFLIS